MTISLYNGLSGLGAHQRLLDVAGHNIANMNTDGYKRSALQLAEHEIQTFRSAIAPSGGQGGVNPTQLGNGVKTGAMTTNFSQGSLHDTERPLDMAIQGEGFFVLNDGNSDFYTRVGNFALDSDSHLVEQSSGYYVQGIDGMITIDKNAPISPQITSEITLKGNLDPETLYPGGPTVKTSIDVLDSLGASHQIDLTLEKTGDWTWDMKASLPNSDGTLSDDFVEGLTFAADGSFTGVTGTGSGNNQITVTFDGLALSQDITFDFGIADAYNGLTQLDGDSSAAAIDQDGYKTGSLSSLSVNPDGTIVGQYTNGESRELANVEIATFNNPEGLEKKGDNLYQSSMNSGAPRLGKGLSGRAGSVLGGKLENSNVEVSNEIASMIVAQRGYQLNARVVSVSNQVMEELANLVR